MIEKFDIPDPLFSQQWHLVNEDYSEKSLNVSGVWEMGITGKGVITSFVDDGVDYTSLDLKDNFVRPFTAKFSHYSKFPAAG
jgi:kexin